MSPQNILTSNVVFEVPLITTMERLEEKLSIDGTLSFVKSVASDQRLFRRESTQNLIQEGTMISDLLPDDLKKDTRLIELMLSDAIVKPAMSRTNSNN